MQPPAASEFYALQQRVSVAARNEVRRIWQRRMGDDFDGSWRRIEADVLAVIAEGQSQMALAAGDYGRDVLGQLDIPDRPEGEIVPDALVGVASDGRSLESLAAQSVVTAKVAVRDGANAGQALDEGGAWLQLMAGLQVADAARVAVGIGVASRRNLAGHVRVLNPPVCQRCAILGGRFYRWSSGFDRHPGDDCTMMPTQSEAAARADGLMYDPKAAYRAGQIKDITEAQAKAIAEGAELQDVVNAYRGMSTTAAERALSPRLVREQEKAAAAQAARTAASIQSGMPDLLASIPTAVRFQTRTARLTPEGIYRIAGDDRDEAIRLLREWSYID